MAFKFYLDDQLTDNPDNGTELVTVIKRDSELGGFLITQEVTLAYNGNNEPEPGTISGYTYLKNKFDSGTCNIIDIVIYDEIGPTETYRIYTGTIIVPSMQIEEHLVRLTCKIDDNGFYAYIKNNANIPFNLYSTKTKNSLTITPPDIYEVDMFDSLTGTFLSLPPVGVHYRGYRVVDVLSYLVGAISDNKVSFSSDYLENQAVPIFLFDGAALANPDTNPTITVTLKELLDELRKLKNLSFYIDQSDPDAPVFRLEQASWFYVGNQVLSFDDPKEIRTSIKTTKIFGTVKVGSEYNPGGAGSVYTWNAGASYFGWKEEVYTPYGQCNTDSELDLVNAFYISSNAVNDQVNGVTTSNYDARFLVECQNVDTVNLTASAVDWPTYSSTAVRYYNVGFNNVNKIALHGGNFQQALSNTTQPGTNVFHASLGSDVTLIDQTGGSGLQFPQLYNPFVFADEFGGNNFDPGNNYDNLTGIYIAPLPGNYSFNATINFEALNFKECATGASILYVPTGQTIFTQVNYGFKFTLSIRAYTDSTLTSQVDATTLDMYNFVNQQYTFPISFTTPLNAGNAVVVEIVVQAEAYAPAIFGNTPLTSDYVIQDCSYSASEPRQLIIALEDSTFECNGTPDGGLILAPFDPQAYKVRLHEFDYDISASDFRQIAAAPLGMFTFTKDGVSRTGWLEELRFNNWTKNGPAKIKLVSEDV